METKLVSKTTKTKAKQVSTTPIRVRYETKKRLLLELSKANKKSYGKKVRIDALITIALNHLTDKDVNTLQEQSLSNADRLEISYREHVKKHGSISKDDFIGIVLGTASLSSENEDPSEKSKYSSAAATQIDAI